MIAGRVYSSIQTCVTCLKDDVDGAKYSKWLVVLTDTADFQIANDKGQFDQLSAGRAQTAVDGVLNLVQPISGLNFAIIDASGITRRQRAAHQGDGGGRDR